VLEAYLLERTKVCTRSVYVCHNSRIVFSDSWIVIHMYVIVPQVLSMVPVLVVALEWTQNGLISYGIFNDELMYQHRGCKIVLRNLCACAHKFRF